MQGSDLWHPVLFVSEQMAICPFASWLRDPYYHTFTPLFLNLQTSNAHLHHVRTLLTDETHLPGVPPAADHSGRVPLHEGLTSLQHQWVFVQYSQRTKQQNKTLLFISFQSHSGSFFSFACDLTSAFLCFHQFQLRVWRAKSTLMNCVIPTSTNSIDSSNIEWPPVVLRGSTSWPGSWTPSKWWGARLGIILAHSFSWPARHLLLWD